MNPRIGGWKHSRNAVIIVCGQLFFLLGCGGPELLPVEGKVSFPDQSPLHGGWVEMQSIDGTGGTPRGPIQPDGTFRIGTVKEGDGAGAGKYRVLVSPPGGPNPGVPLSEQPPPVRLVAKFLSFKTSGIEFEVDPNKDENRLDITVERAK